MNLPTDDIKDITIIGAGPSGLFTAFQAGMHEASVRIIDSMPEPGGQLTALYPEKYIFDAPGFTKITAKELAENLFAQANQFTPEFCLNETVITIANAKVPAGSTVPSGSSPQLAQKGTELNSVPGLVAEHPGQDRDGETAFELLTDKGRYLSKAVIIAAGLGAFKPRSPGKPGIDKFEGNGVYYTVKEKGSFRGKDIVIAGGGDSALDWVINLLDTAQKIYLVHRSDTFRAHPHTVQLVSEQAKQGRIQVLTPYEIKEVTGNEHLEYVALSDGSGREVPIKADALLLMLGFTSDLGPIGKWGLEIDDSRIKVGQNMAASRKGIFAVGDIANYPGKLKLILTGFSDGAQAVRSAVPYIRPGDKFRHVHSTSSKLFGKT
ncbi:MAG: NAD(P)/FAD-dependent oxidoreductase [Nitrospirae bacterium]|nr:NAD(P)/FAD-dependent oxidoreductase [Nitrospirota bacterium]